jgi:two-component system phosphate regulon response regulator PhoB
MSLTSILLVEDNDDLRTLLQDAMREAGFAVQSIPLAAHIFEVLHGDTFDLIVLDLGMPQGTLQGMEALTRLRTIEVWRELPVIILSAFGDVVNRTLTSRLGVADIVAKPFDVQELIASLQRVAGRGRTGNTAT